MTIPESLSISSMKEDSDVATNVNYGVALILSWYIPTCNSEMGIMRINAPQRLLPQFKNEYLERAQTSWLTIISPKGKPLGSHMIG